ncbi:molybdopterin molybdotransferase MoeA [Halodesulfovibrio aestuarii]|uniref:molybdopterin molybdotransferase MoeA n=1 Tax=Halodesulfovibrio aestuarii TaxID=126333 RepID=UPI003D342C42
MKKDFFNVLSVQEFIQKLHAFTPLHTHTVSIDAADGYVLAENIIAAENLPLASRSCMDGYAINAANVFGASEANPAYLESVGDIDIEQPASFTLKDGECAGIVTGGILPEGADAVVMIEHTESLGAGTVEIRKSLAPYENVMLKGEDAATGKDVFTAGTLIRPQEIGMLAALGIQEVSVYSPPRVGIISTGDELIPINEKPIVGQVRDVNSYTLAACARRAGAAATTYGLVEDKLDALKSALENALSENDVVFLSGGSSVGVRDLTVGAIDKIEDAEIINHGVAISPGKPLILAKCGNKAIWGLPGQVASAQVVMFVLGMPFLRYLGGNSKAFDQSRWPSKQAIISRNVASKPGREDYVRVSVTVKDGNTIATPVLGKSGLLKTMLQADGVTRIGADSEGIYEGTAVDVLFF